MTFALIGIALIPTIIIFSVVLKKTPTVKRGPYKRLVKVFIISALSTIVATILEVIGIVVLALMYNSNTKAIMSMSGLFALCVFVIGLSEELCKYFTFKLTIFNDRNFDHTYDGVVYGAAAALGFATLENILYIFQFSTRSGIAVGAFTGFLRAVLSVPMHAFTGIFMGYYFGVSKYKKYNSIEYNKNPQRRAFLLSVVVHGLYDFLAMASNATDAPENFEYMAIAGVIFIMIIVYVLMYQIINKASKEDLMIYNEYYYRHLNGQLQDMIGKTNENGGVFVNAQNVPNYTNGYQPHTMAGQPLTWQYGQQTNNNYQQPVGYPYTNAQNDQYGYQPNNNFQTSNDNPYSNGQYVPRNSGSYPQPSAFAYGQNFEPVRQPHTPISTQTMNPEKVIFCNKCGNRLTNNTKFCPLCGNMI